MNPGICNDRAYVYRIDSYTRLICQAKSALQPKFLPKERFQLIEHADKLLTKKQAEFADVMEAYLKVRACIHVCTCRCDALRSRTGGGSLQFTASAVADRPCHVTITEWCVWAMTC